MVANGYTLLFASPGGKPARVDPVSDEHKWFAAAADRTAANTFVAAHPAIAQLRASASLTARELGTFTALFVPGGHAPLEDLWQDTA